MKMQLTTRIFRRAGTVGATAALAAASITTLTALSSAPASAQPVTVNTVYTIPNNMGYGDTSVPLTSQAPATVSTGSNYTDAITPSPYTVPAQVTIVGTVATVNSFQGFQFLIPIPPNATYVSSSLSSSTATFPGGSVPFTLTYCTAASSACTATASSTTYGGTTTTPYLELATPGYGSSAITADEIAAGVTLTFPTASIVLAASGAIGSTIQPQLSEFDSALTATATITGLGTITLTEPVASWPAAVLTLAQELPGAPLPPMTFQPLSTTTIVAQPPTVTSISPTSGPTAGGTTVTITGTGFGGATKVAFGTTPAASYIVVSSTKITAVSPAEPASTKNIRVTTAGGTSAAVTGDKFTFKVPAPVVSSISPTSGPTSGGTTVTITGTGFGGATKVAFGTTPAASYIVVSSTKITAVSPAEPASTKNIRVTTAGGTSAAVSGDKYTFQ